MQGLKADSTIIFDNMQVMFNIIPAYSPEALYVFELAILFNKYHAKYFLCEINPMTLLWAL